MEFNSLNGNGSRFKDSELVTIDGFGSDYEVLFSTYITLIQNTTTVAYICQKNGVKTPLILQEFLSPNQSTPITVEPLPNTPMDVAFKFAVDDIVKLVNPLDVDGYVYYSDWKITKAYIGLQSDIYIPLYELEITITNIVTNETKPFPVNGVTEELIYV